MKKIIFGLMGIIAAVTLIVGNDNTLKETQTSAEKIVQYSHGHTGG
ncbi:hypothetical protein QUF88_13990 [Bacillus sp. DX1.1]|nr:MULTISPECIES: hypothetical protein [unclassified Bacillus (in: firmicutes)]MDM5154891.1 hypothetical protein [Bacillus sp. DX1.1]WJE83762.1 hypothetical protein QRE67_11485 [Bacillus sp. DX3.1]